MKNNNFINKITLGDTLNLIKQIEDNSIDLILTDPPYFLDKLDNNWDPKDVSSTKYQYTVTSLPAGMKFTREQGVNLYNWYKEISKEYYRVLKPGGFIFSFSSPRLYHRMASAVDDAGFEIRDAFAWIYNQNQPKAMSIAHILKRVKMDEEEKNKLLIKLEGWKTPQIKSLFEPIVFGQKPKEGNNAENIIKYEVGLMNTNVKVGQNMYPANLLTIDNIDIEIDNYCLVKKPDKKEKGEYNIHSTVKPIEICEHLIKLTAFSSDAVVLDPFMGSGTTAIAAIRSNVNYIGFEINQEYLSIANQRINEVENKL